MSDTILGVGIACILAAIAGGGFEAFGVKVPVIHSLRRQKALGAAGGALAVGSQIPAVWAGSVAIWGALFPPHKTEQPFGPATLEPGDYRVVPVSLGHDGPIDVTITQLNPDPVSPNGQHGAVRQYGLSIRICQVNVTGDCPDSQQGLGGTAEKDLRAGRAQVTVFNYATNPRLSFVLSLAHY